MYAFFRRYKRKPNFFALPLERTNGKSYAQKEAILHPSRQDAFFGAKVQFYHSHRDKGRECPCSAMENVPPRLLSGFLDFWKAVLPEIQSR